MAGVDHAYQYSVEVKSRFSLFMDDSFNNEDPDLLISKLQNERVERARKEKIQTTTVPRSDNKKVDREPEAEVKQEVGQVKGKQVRMPRLPKSTAQPHDENAETADHKEKSEVVPSPIFRGRGGQRPFLRGFRGGRVQGPRQYHAESTHNGIDDAPPKDPAFEPRGRGRARPRGGFSRGRMMNTDFRETSGQLGADMSHDHADGTQSNWTDADAASTAVDAHQNGIADTALDGACTAEECQENGDKDSITEEQPKSYTLEEYKAMRSQSKQTVTLASRGGRQANDGQDVFANMVAHRKTVEVSDDDIEEIEREEEEPQKFEINFSFNDDYGGRGRQNRGFGNRGFNRGGGFRGNRPRSERGGRGARGSFRGDARGRGFQRGGPPQSGCTPVIYNDQEFPSLK